MLKGLFTRQVFTHNRFIFAYEWVTNMSGFAASFRTRSWSYRLPRFAAVACTAIALAGCSDSARFSNGLFASNSRSAAPSAEVTGSVQRAPAPRVEARALPAPGATYGAPTPSRPATVTAGSAYGAGGLGAYRPNHSSEVTGSVRPQMPPPPSAGWTWEGGQPVTIGAGENIETISRKYGVPQSAILQANGITDTARVRPGQRIVIPRYVGAGAQPQTTASVAAPAAAARAPVSAPVAGNASGASLTHVVEPGQTLLGISRRYGKPVAEIARANKITTYAKLNAGDRLTIPGAAQRAAVASQQPQQQLQPQRTVALVAPHVAQPQTAPAPSTPRTVASAEPTQTARIATPSEPVEAPPTATKSAEAVGAIPSFRWPARGRVIAGYGSKLNGQNNDGINIAVPEGTPVKAAEDGTVAYAGNELKGYGNLVLIRHANGYVSAYAHASELLVKRGDTVKRGQIIGRSGQTGNVTSPQLHFEIRKGSAPVNPNQFLSGNG
jgi:murein DD-endopeptidase MepM/ murein hydrolase activator NlpD